MGINPSNGIAAREAEKRGKTPFINLGDDAHETCSIKVSEEIKAAGLDELPVQVKYHRAWYYWVVSLIGCALPKEQAIALYDKSPDARPFGHCAMTKEKMIEWIEITEERNKKIRGEIPWTDKDKEDLALCLRLKPDFEPREEPVGVNSWHVDTEEALKDLVDALREEFGPFKIEYHKIEKTRTDLTEHHREMLDKFVRLTICEDEDPEEQAQTYLIVGVQGFKIGERKSIEEASWMGEMLAKALSNVVREAEAAALQKAEDIAESYHRPQNDPNPHRDGWNAASIEIENDIRDLRLRRKRDGTPLD